MKRDSTKKKSLDKTYENPQSQLDFNIKRLLSTYFNEWCCSWFKLSLKLIYSAYLAFEEVKILVYSGDTSKIVSL